MGEGLGGIIDSFLSGVQSTSNSNRVSKLDIELEKEKNRGNIISNALKTDNSTQKYIIIVSTIFIFAVVGFVIYKKLK